MGRRDTTPVAICPVVAEHLFEILQTNQNDDAAVPLARYYTAVEQLTAAGQRWALMRTSSKLRP
jgi:hypothetical protein